VEIELQDAADPDGRPDEDEWARWVCETLACVEQRAEGRVNPIGNITVRLVGDDESQRLNSTYRNKSGATNVLAFSGPQDPTLVPDEDRALGDIVICLPVVYREARDQGKHAVAHMAHMAVHGTLHLLGFDHDNEADARRMEDLETLILGRLDFPDPYAIR
jgi:probable rRNA maturation factor